MTELVRSPRRALVVKQPPRLANREEIAYFHTDEYIDFVRAASKQGYGSLDRGDTPAYEGVYEAAAHVVGGTLNALAAIMDGPLRKAFVPIGGLHHAARGAAAGFCVFNDAGVAIEAAMRNYGLERVAYIDIDAHHGDGVFYGFEEDPRVLFADIHEDGRFLYPGTGSRSETGRGPAAGMKLNIPMPMGADDAKFFEAWAEVETYLAEHKPDLMTLNCGADSLAGDPITHLQYTENAHGHAAVRVAALAEKYCAGRVLAWGCGGYNRRNIARAWTRAVEGLAGSE
jgi:acetoin utilization protein AcuC